MTASGSVFLNVGCGRISLPGWINVDLQLLANVDVVADVTQGLGFRSAKAVFAEHFLEHLAVDEALEFFRKVHRVLDPDGWLRLSTPNLEWVLKTHYDPEAGRDPERDSGILELNRAFYGWEHRFLWDRSFLREALTACGFVDLCWVRYGESSKPFFRGLERHERDADAPDLPHVLVVEARKGPRRPKRLAALQRRVQERFLGHLEEARLRRARLEIERLRRELKECEARHRGAGATVRRRKTDRFRKARTLWRRLRRALGFNARRGGA